MFTGIIEATGNILSRTDSGLVISRPAVFDDLKIGCSIAVSGVCLSVVAFDKKSMSFDVVPMSFSKTKFGSLQIGDSVNLERAMRADSRFEGHIVTGHCEGVGRVVTLPTRDFAPTPGPSPWPSIAYAMSGKQGEGSSALSQFSRMLGRVWKGTSDSKRASHLIVERARGMRPQPTDAERKLWDALKNNSFRNIRFRRQHVIGNYIVDFYADALKLVIEVDGGIHNDSALREYEDHRTLDLNSRGISVMRFSNHDIHDRFDDVLNAISSFRKPPLTRQIEDERSESEIPGEGPGVGAKKVQRDKLCCTGLESGVMNRENSQLPEFIVVGEVQGDCDNGNSHQRRQENTIKSSALPASGPCISKWCERAILTPLHPEGGGVGGGGTVKLGEGPGVNRITGTLLTLSVPENLLPFIVLHGSITLDGVALTVADLKSTHVTVAIIPHTLAETTLGSLKKGSTVNVETDIIGKYILTSHGSQRNAQLRYAGH